MFLHKVLGEMLTALGEAFKQVWHAGRIGNGLQRKPAFITINVRAQEAASTQTMDYNIHRSQNHQRSNYKSQYRCISFNGFKYDGDDGITISYFRFWLLIPFQ